jgi:hypothetical protein
MDLSAPGTYTGILEQIKTTLTPETNPPAEDFFVYILSKPTDGTDLFAFSANSKDSTDGSTNPQAKLTKIDKAENSGKTINDSLADKITDTLKNAYEQMAGGGARKSRRGGKTKKNIKRRK